MQVEFITKGTGPIAKVGQKVICHYTGKLTNGTVFDSSVKRGTPFKFNAGVGQVIKAWDQLFIDHKLNVGSKCVIKAPSNICYGSQAVGGVIPANSDLIFEIEFLGIE